MNKGNTTVKRVLGLDLGTNSIGWALVEEHQIDKKVIDGSIIKLGVRVNPLTVDEKTNFEKGKPISTNADRTLKRGARRNLQRFKLRRENLIDVLRKHGFIDKETVLAENGKNSTHNLLNIRAKSAKEKVSLEEFARILLAINKKRGYKSSRKTKQEADGTAIDGMGVAKILYDENLTPGQYGLQLLENGKKYIPDFYRSDLQNEFDLIWEQQKRYYPEILNNELYQALQDKNKSQTWAICQEPFNIVGIKLTGKADEQKRQRFLFRTKGLNEKLELEHLAIALQEINNDKNKSSGYLGNISDRSKILYIDKITVGEFLYRQIERNPHTSLKNQVFYRQDYLDEFETIWETQAKFHSVLNPKLKEEIRDIVIFYQRKLKSQKGLISFCQFESWREERKDKNGNIIINKLTDKPKMRWAGARVIPKSSPLFQESKIWQGLRNLKFVNKTENEVIDFKKIDHEIRKVVFEELNLRGDLKPNEILDVLNPYYAIRKKSNWKCNLEKIEGNRTNKSLFNVYQLIAEREGYGFDWNKKTAKEIREELKAIFPSLGIKAEILDFNSHCEQYDKQASYQLWHLLYSAEEDDKITPEDREIYGNTDVKLRKVLHNRFGFKPEYTKLVSNISLSDDYGNLSTRALRKIMPFLQDGHDYYEACKLAGYNHSNSFTAEELAKRELKDRLELLTKNSLRNPVVEKILNQMINLINQVCDTYGKPDEIRIELARELKKTAKERADAQTFINKSTKANDEIRKIIEKDFGFKPTKSDVTRYKLWEELGKNGYKTIFTNTQIPKEKIFSKEVDIEHIIPKALLFDDSFSNKTLAYREINIKKGSRTAIDFITEDYHSELDEYHARVEDLYQSKAISKGKYKKMLMSAKNIPDGFIERDLRNSQYIAKKAKELLLEVFPTVVATSGRITDKLRKDWDLINIMKELSLPKYRALGLTEIEKRWDSGQEKEKEIEVIKDWTKRNDHRHHAMDALTVAFTTHNHIQYINYLNARRDEDHKKHSNIIAIENLITSKKEGKNGKTKRVYTPPMENFRQKAKKQIEEILISFKTKNKVVTNNINKAKGDHREENRKQKTPRGQLHKETVYGKSKRLAQKPLKLSKKTSLDQIDLMVNKEQKHVVLQHLHLFENNPQIAFDTKTLKKTPLLWKDEPLKDVSVYEEIFTIRKEIGPDLKIDKVVDEKIRIILKNRLSEFGNNAKKAFSDLEKNPIWLNKEKGIAIKRVTITGVSNAEALHYKKDHFGNAILDKNGQKQAVDFVSTGNNHHVAIYKDEKGNLQEKVVSFYEAVARVNENLPIIDKSFNQQKGWEFLFTMKQNEMFLFPSEDFDPTTIDLMNAKNSAQISKHLFRVQKIASKNYMFTHHLETQATTSQDLKSLKALIGKKYYFIQSTVGLKNIIKVRINHIGKIVQIGEY
ncbi:MAG: type II CRISPR RNA-guided endonuclease Cas9 [Flavobacteriales bacterium]|jgi:CRISPR-associated endonuclease Csn1|nr:type II CRISPR RNA-guided endonuclease Cas9 [Flavobacteriales bacterium]